MVSDPRFTLIRDVATSGMQTFMKILKEK
jgi:hypothetical protein